MSLTFSIISPIAACATGEAAMVTAPGSEGEFGILPNHMPFATLLRAGCVIIEYENGNKDFYYIRSGFLRASEEEVMLLVDEVKKPDALDAASLRQAIRDKEDDLLHLKSEEAAAPLRTALSQLKAQLETITRAAA